MSISINGETFGLQYVDCPSDFWELPGASLSVDAWGMDTLTRRFAGRLDYVRAEVAKYKRDRKKRDSEFPELYVTSYSADWSAPFASLTVTYKGVFDGKKPEPVIKQTGVRRNSVQLDYTGPTPGTLAGNSASFTYRAPYMTMLYVTKERPKEPRFKDRLDPTEVKLRRIGGSRGDVAIFTGKAGSKPIPINMGHRNSYNGVAFVENTQFDIVPAGQWWEVTETNEVTIEPLDGTKVRVTK